MAVGIERIAEFVQLAVPLDDIGGDAVGTEDDATVGGEPAGGHHGRGRKNKVTGVGFLKSFEIGSGKSLLVRGTNQDFWCSEIAAERGEVMERVRGGGLRREGAIFQGSAVVGRNLEGKPVLMFVGEKMKGEADLFQVAEAFRFLGAQLCLAEGRQEQRSEDANDGDNDEQFDQRESGGRRVRGPGLHGSMMRCTSLELWPRASRSL